MNDNYEVSIDRIKEALPAELITDEFQEAVKQTGERFSQVIVNEGDYYLTTIHEFFKISGDAVEKFKKDDVKEVKFIKPVPHGEVYITMENGDELHLSDIVAGRAFDFIQDVKPKQITLSGYDNTIRGEFPQLLDPDHAEEIDRLRRWMQDGHISHYQYDDANPVYPKAGK